MPFYEEKLHFQDSSFIISSGVQSKAFLKYEILKA